jgi:hypothetical protein
LGPPWVRSNTCLGLSNHWNFCSSFAPWFPPDLGLMNTMIGFTLTVGIGLITKVRWSGCKFYRFREWSASLKESFLTFSLLFFLLFVFFLGDLRRLDLKLPLRGSFTIHDGGTMMLEWTPKQQIHSRYFKHSANCIRELFN